MVSGGFADSVSGTAVVSRADGDDGWTVRTWPGGSTLTVYAYCSKHRGVSASKKSVATRPNGKNTVATAECGANESAVSGGYVFNPQESNWPTFKSWRRGPRTWSIMAVLGNGPAQLEAIAYCRRHADVTVRSANSAPIGENEVDSVTAHCHPGEQLLSGGYATKPTPDWDNKTGPDLFYYHSARAGKRGWQASALNYSAVSGRIVAYAYCAS